MHTITLTEKENGLRLDRFLRERFGLSQAMVQKGLRKKLIRVDGARAEAAQRIQAGQTVVLRLAIPDITGSTPKKRAATDRASSRLTPQQIAETQRWILYETPYLTILNKPAGLPVQGGSGVRDSIDARLFALSNGGERPRLVHRLDRDTSGCLLLARTRQDAAALATIFANREVEKIYWALVTGVPQPYTGLVDAPLAKEMAGNDKEKMQLSESGKKAVTAYRLLERLGDRLSLVELKPLTGRTHQLRAHMAHLGCPIVGDGKYGGEMAEIGGMPLSQKLHLHARRLVIDQHPYTLDITAPLPQHMADNFRALGLDE